MVFPKKTRLHVASVPRISGMRQVVLLGLALLALSRVSAGLGNDTMPDEGEEEEVRVCLLTGCSSCTCQPLHSRPACGPGGSNVPPGVRHGAPEIYALKQQCCRWAGQTASPACGPPPAKPPHRACPLATLQEAEYVLRVAQVQLYLDGFEALGTGWSDMVLVPTELPQVATYSILYNPQTADPALPLCYFFPPLNLSVRNLIPGFPLLNCFTRGLGCPASCLQRWRWGGYTQLPLPGLGAHKRGPIQERKCPSWTNYMPSSAIKAVHK